jgi:hypothetical protein
MGMLLVMTLRAVLEYGCDFGSRGEPDDGDLRSRENFRKDRANAITLVTAAEYACALHSEA